MTIDLPVEITDQIIDHLHTDKDALCQCSLVCKRWTHSARLHLFSSLFIAFPKTDRILNLLVAGSSTFVPYLRNLTIQGWDAWEDSEALPERINEPFSTLPTFPAVDVLALHELDWVQLNDTAKRFILTLVPQLIGLELVEVNFGYLEEAQSFIMAAPLLKRLSINGKEMFSSPILPTVRRQHPCVPRLQLYIDGLLADAFKFWILNSSCEVLETQGIVIDSIVNRAPVIGPSLKHLKFRFDSHHDAIIFANSVMIHLTNLRSLTLSGKVRSELSNLLVNVASTHLHTVIWTGWLMQGYPIFGDMTTVQRTLIDESLLAGRNGVILRCIETHGKPKTWIWDNFVKIVKASMPLLDAQGRLDVLWQGGKGDYTPFSLDSDIVPDSRLYKKFSRC